jgi:hypothetical protein
MAVKSASAAPTMMLNAPVAAAFGPPLIGASRKCPPRAVTAWPISRLRLGSTVAKSMK